MYQSALMFLPLTTKCCLSRRDTKNLETGSNPKLALFNKEIKRQMKESLNRSWAKEMAIFPKPILLKWEKLR